MPEPHTCPHCHQAVAPGDDDLTPDLFAPTALDLFDGAHHPGLTPPPADLGGRELHPFLGVAL